MSQDNNGSGKSIDKKDKQPIPDKIEKDELDLPEEEIDIPEELLESIPKEDRPKFIGLIKSTFSSFAASFTRQSHPIADKITPEHISAIFKNQDEEDKRDRTERKGIRRYSFYYFIIALIFLGILIYIFREDRDLLGIVLIAFLSCGAGIGIGQYIRKN